MPSMSDVSSIDPPPPDSPPRDKSSKVRVGVVGVGHLGQHHARNYSEMKGCNLVGVVDVDHRSATRIAAQFRTQAFFDHRLLIGQVEAVSIVVPTSAHYKTAMDFLNAGIHVLVEK